MVRDYKEEPIEMVNIGTWASWTGDGPVPVPGADSSAGADAPVPGIGSGGGGDTGGGGGRRGGGGGSGGGDDTSAPESAPRSARPDTPFHRSHPGMPKAGAPGEAYGPGSRPDTPFHRAHPGIPRAHWEDSGVGKSESLAQQRAGFKREWETNPNLRERMYNIGAGENQDPQANLAVYETMMNRSAMRGKSLSSEATYNVGGGRGKGYYAGHHPPSAKLRELEDKNIQAAFAGSNVSNYATGNASGNFARNRLAGGVYPGGLRYKKAGEYFVGEGNRGTGRGSYQGWLNRTKAGEAGAGGDNSGHRLAIGGGPKPAPSISAPESRGGTLSAVTTGPHPAGSAAARGDINIGGHHYPFVTGGFGKGAIPYGNWRIGARENHPKLGGSSYPLIPETYKGGRSGFFIHRGGPRGSLGCVHIDPRQYRSFETDLAKGGYNRLSVGPSNTVTKKDGDK